MIYRQKMPIKSADKDGTAAREDAPIPIGTIRMVIMKVEDICWITMLKLMVGFYSSENN